MKVWWNCLPGVVPLILHLCAKWHISAVFQLVFLLDKVHLFMKMTFTSSSKYNMSCSPNDPERTVHASYLSSFLLIHFSDHTSFSSSKSKSKSNSKGAAAKANQQQPLAKWPRELTDLTAHSSKLVWTWLWPQNPSFRNMYSKLKVWCNHLHWLNMFISCHKTC